MQSGEAFVLTDLVVRLEDIRQELVAKRTELHRAVVRYVESADQYMSPRMIDF
jgi:hypothetical protein